MSKNISVWQDYPRQNYRSVEAPDKYDAVIVGGGITGISAGYFLTLTGMRVAIIEKHRLANGDSGQTTAQLTYMTDCRLSELVKMHGRDNAALTWEGGRMAIDLIQQIAIENKLQQFFQRVPGFLYASTEAGHKEADFFCEKRPSCAENWAFPWTTSRKFPW